MRPCIFNILFGSWNNNREADVGSVGWLEARVYKISGAKKWDSTVFHATRGTKTRRSRMPCWREETLRSVALPRVAVRIVLYTNRKRKTRSTTYFHIRLSSVSPYSSSSPLETVTARRRRIIYIYIRFHNKTHRTSNNWTEKYPPSLLNRVEFYPKVTAKTSNDPISVRKKINYFKEN